MGFAQEREDALCDDAAHVLDRGELFEFGRLELRERTEVLSKRECRGFAHVAAAERIEKARKRRVLGALDAVHEILRGLRTHALFGLSPFGKRRHRLRKRLDREFVEVGGRSHEPFVDQHLDHLFTESVDPRRAARGVVHEAKLHLSSAVKPPGAAAVLFLFVPDHGRTADGTAFGHLEASGVFGATFGDRAHDLGNHVSRAAHDDGVADREIERGDVVFVVKRRVRNGDAAHEDGRKTRDGREFARAAHLNVNRLEDRKRLFGRIFVCARPTGLAREKAEFAL